MSFPQPGDRNVLGQVAWQHFVPAISKWVGAVVAFASIYGTPRAYVDDNLNEFSFASDAQITSDAVTFDVIAGNHSPFATNVVAKV